MVCGRVSWIRFVILSALGAYTPLALRSGHAIVAAADYPVAATLVAGTLGGGRGLREKFFAY